jgi:hypothetical protein
MLDEEFYKAGLVGMQGNLEAWLFVKKYSLIFANHITLRSDYSTG